MAVIRVPPSEGRRCGCSGARIRPGVRPPGCLVAGFRSFRWSGSTVACSAGGFGLGIRDRCPHIDHTRTIQVMPDLIGSFPTGCVVCADEGFVGADEGESVASRSGGWSVSGGRVRLVRVDVAGVEVFGLGAVGLVADRCRVSAEVLGRLGRRGVAGAEVWEVLTSSRRLVSRLGAETVVVFGVTGVGRCLVLLLRGVGVGGRGVGCGGRSGDECCRDRFVRLDSLITPALPVSLFQADRTRTSPDCGG